MLDIKNYEIFFMIMKKSKEEKISFGSDT